MGHVPTMSAYLVLLIGSAIQPFVLAHCPLAQQTPGLHSGQIGPGLHGCFLPYQQSWRSSVTLHPWPPCIHSNHIIGLQLDDVIVMATHVVARRWVSTCIDMESGFEVCMHNCMFFPLTSCILVINRSVSSVPYIMHTARSTHTFTTWLAQIKGKA